MVDQAVLTRIIGLPLPEPGMARDLDSATRTVAQLTATITTLTEDDTLYKAILSESKTNLEAILATKLISLPSTPAISRPTWESIHAYGAEVVLPTTPNTFVYYTSGGGISAGVEPVWPLVPGNTVVDGTVTWECESLAISYGTTYNVSNISDWQIRAQPADVSIYQYQNTIADAKTYVVIDSNNGNITYRNIVSGFSQSLNWVRIGIQGHSTNATTVINVSISERSGATQDIVPGTMEFFEFSGSNRVNINPGVIQYTDWLEYDVDSAKTYFITIFVDGLYFTYNGSGNLYYRNGDYSLEENWGITGSSLGQTGSIKVIQGWLNGLGQGWDGDVNIVKWIDSYDAAYKIIYNYPFGAYYMLRSMNTALGYCTTRKNNITARNIILPYFVPIWIATHTYLAGEDVIPTTTSTHVYYTLAGGISSGIEPIWPTILGSTIVDGTVTWECVV